MFLFFSDFSDPVSIGDSGFHGDSYQYLRFQTVQEVPNPCHFGQ